MLLSVLGWNSVTTPPEIRDKLKFSQYLLTQRLDNLMQLDNIHECVILATDNRTEIYTATTDIENSLKETLKYLADISGVSSQELEDYLYVHSLYDTIRHLFMAASGLDSIGGGEQFVLEHVKRAYQTAYQHGSTNIVLNTLFRQAINTGEKVEREVFNAGQSDQSSTKPVRTAESIVEEDMERFLTKLNSEVTGNTIRLLNKKAANIKTRALTKALNRLNNITTEQKNIVELTAENIVNQILHEPIEKLGEISSPFQGHWYAEIAKNLFSLKNEEAK